MTKQELNRDIKRLWKKYQNREQMFGSSNYYQWEEECVKEFKRLYYADDSFEYMNRFSILAMLQMNISWRVISFHHFGSNIKLS